LPCIQRTGLSEVREIEFRLPGTTVDWKYFDEVKNKMFSVACLARTEFEKWFTDDCTSVHPYFAKTLVNCMCQKMCHTNNWLNKIVTTKF
jgi:hypothetical protein